MRRCWSGSRTPIEWYQNKLLSSHLQAADVQNATNKVTFAKSTPSDAFYYTCTSNGLIKLFPNLKQQILTQKLQEFSIIPSLSIKTHIVFNSGF